MLYWQCHFENEILVNCLFTQWKWTYTLDIGPWRWSALNMGLVDKWPSRMQGQRFFRSRVGGQQFSVGSKKIEFSRPGAVSAQIYLHYKFVRGTLMSPKADYHFDCHPKFDCRFDRMLVPLSLYYFFIYKYCIFWYPWHPTRQLSLLRWPIGRHLVHIFVCAFWMGRLLMGGFLKFTHTLFMAGGLRGCYSTHAWCNSPKWVAVFGVFSVSIMVLHWPWVLFGGTITHHNQRHECGLLRDI